VCNKKKKKPIYITRNRRNNKLPIFIRGCVAFASLILVWEGPSFAEWDEKKLATIFIFVISLLPEIIVGLRCDPRQNVLVRSMKAEYAYNLLMLLAIVVCISYFLACGGNPAWMPCAKKVTIISYIIVSGLMIIASLTILLEPLLIPEPPDNLLTDTHVAQEDKVRWLVDEILKN